MSKRRIAKNCVQMVINVTLPAPLATAFECEAEKRQGGKSEVVRDALTDYLAARTRGPVSATPRFAMSDF